MNSHTMEMSRRRRTPSSSSSKESPCVVAFTSPHALHPFFSHIFLKSSTSLRCNVSPNSVNTSSSKKSITSPATTSTKFITTRNYHHPTNNPSFSNPTTASSNSNHSTISSAQSVPSSPSSSSSNPSSSDPPSPPVPSLRKPRRIAVTNEDKPTLLDPEDPEFNNIEQDANTLELESMINSSSPAISQIKDDKVTEQERNQSNGIEKSSSKSPNNANMKKKPRNSSGTVDEIESQVREEMKQQQLNVSYPATPTTEIQNDEINPMLSLSERLRLEGHESEIKGEHALASQLYARAIELDPLNGKAWQNLSKTEGKRKRSMKVSANILKKALKENPSNPYLWQSLGFILFRMRRYDEARLHFQTGISKNSRHAPLYSTWAHLEYAVKNIPRARELYDQGSRLEDGGARVFHNWGQMELKLGNDTRAVELFELGLKADPRNSFIWETLGSYTWKKQKNYEKAKKCFINALNSDKINIIAFDSWAKLEGQVNNIEKAREIFQKGILYDSRDARLLQSFSQFEFRNNELELAKKQIEKAVLLSPTDSSVWTQYAKIEAALSHYPRARAMFNRACEINSKDWKAWDAWSVMEHQLGNFQQAEKLLHESFRVRFNAKGDFTVLANSVTDKFI